MNRIHRLSVVALTMGFLTATSANAELLIDDGSSPAPQATSVPASKPTGSFFNNTSPSAAPVVSAPVISAPASVSATSSHVTQTGTPVVGAPVKGWAKDIPLSTALKQIVPNGWKARKSGNVDLNQSVSWTGGKDWVSVLGDLTADYRFNASVNWNTKEIYITPLGSSTVVTASTPTTLAPRPVFSGSTTTKFATPVSNSVSSGYSYNQTWTLSKSKTLRENIEDWAKQAGWTVSWGAPDYRIVADVTLTGAIDAQDGPIARVIAAYKDADQPLRASLSSGNKVIRIESRNFQQETVVGSSINDTFTNLDKR